MPDDIRARRAERARREKRKGMPKQMARYAVYAVIGLAIVAAVGWAATHQPPAKKFAHEHAAFSMFVNGQQVDFGSPQYDCRAAQICDAVHMHTASETPESHVLHIEGLYLGGNPDWTLQKTFEQYGFRFAKGDITMDTRAGHDGKEYRDQGNATWRFLVSKVAGEQRQPFQNVTDLVPDYTQYVPREQDKVLMTYGDLTPQQIQQQEQSIPDASEWAPRSAP
jgi:hypothetical protein